MVSPSRFSKSFNVQSGLLIMLFCFVAHPKASAQTQPDTSLASQQFAKAEKFAKAAQYDSACLYYEKAAAIYKAVGLAQDGSNPWEKFIQCYNGLGVVLRRQGKYDRALECLHKALETGLTKLGRPNLAVAASYHGVGVVYSNTGDYKNALEYFHKSLQTKLPILGEKHSSVASSYNSIGNVYRAKGDYDKALEHYRNALQIGLQTVGDQHPAVSAAYNNIGIVYYDKGDYESALEYFHKSLFIELHTLGEKHPSPFKPLCSFTISRENDDTGSKLFFLWKRAKPLCCTRRCRNRRPNNSRPSLRICWKRNGS